MIKLLELTWFPSNPDHQKIISEFAQAAQALYIQYTYKKRQLTLERALIRGSLSCIRPAVSTKTTSIRCSLAENQFVDNQLFLLQCSLQLTFRGVSWRAGRSANRPADRMILLAWFDNLQESFSYKDVQFKTFCSPIKNSWLPAENVNKPLRFVEASPK